MNQYQTRLQERGVVVIPVLSPARRQYYYDKIMSEVRNFPEYKNIDRALAPWTANRTGPNATQDTTGLVKSKFAACGNPTAFHTKGVQELRQEVHHECCKKLFKDAPFPYLPYTPNLINKKEWNVEQLADRLMVRPPNQKPNGESWHRDLSKIYANQSMIDQTFEPIFGGWVNLNNFSHTFSCVPTTHKMTFPTDARGGFDTAIARQKARWNREKERIIIPPGHQMVFYERTVHEVYPGKINDIILRLFVGYKITTNKVCNYGDDNAFIQRLKDNHWLPLKSGQKPPMYSQFQWTNWAPQLVKWSANMKDICCEMKTPKSGGNAGRNFRVVHRFMKSVKEYRDMGDDSFVVNDYQPHDIEVLMPRRKWTLKYGGNTYEVDLDKEDNNNGASTLGKRENPIVIDYQPRIVRMFNLRL